MEITTQTIRQTRLTQSFLVKPQVVSSVLAWNSWINVDKIHAKRIKKDIQYLIKTYQPYSVLTEHLSIDDVSNAIKELKKG